MDVNLPLDPPVNNNLQATLYDKIDAITFEKIRVANTQLNSRLEIQERILNKYRKEAEKIHDNQYRKIHREFIKIHRKRPDYVDDFEYGRTKHDSESKLSKARSLSETSDCSSYCRRYYSHHFHIKDREKEKEGDLKKKRIENDYFNARLRCFFLNMVNYAKHSPMSPTCLEHDENIFAKNDGSMAENHNLLQESADTFQELEEEVFERLESPRQSILSKGDLRSNLSKFGDSPVRGTVVNALRMGLENICNNSEDTRRSTAGLRLEAIEPRKLHRKEKRTKHRRRSRIQEDTDQGILSRSLDPAMFRTGALQTDLNGYPRV